MIDLRLGDCSELIGTIPDNSVDLTVTSPPYDTLRAYNGNIHQWNFEKFTKVAAELYRVTSDGGVLVWIVGDATVRGCETGTSFRQALTFIDVGFNLHDTMIYAKHNPPPTGGKNRYYQSFEFMFVFSKGVPKTFNPLTEPRRNICNDKRTQRNKCFTRNADGEFTKKVVSVNQHDPKRRNVWTYLVGGGHTTDDKIAYSHPAMFPEQLAADHILTWSNSGDLVFDPFMGSGTTGKQARLLGRRFIGMEIDPEYFDLATQRVRAAHEEALRIVESTM